MANGPATAKVREVWTSASAGEKRGPSVEPGSYSKGFADSTKGTALLSPPDPATSSPLEWTPGLSTGFPDMATRQFLAPSLRGGGHSLKKTRGSATQAKSPGKTPADSGIASPTWSTSLSDGLEPNGLGTSDLPTSIDQQ